MDEKDFSRGGGFSRLESRGVPEPNIVYFDLETQKSAEEVGGWDKIRDMKMSVGVIFEEASQRYCIFSEAQVDDLIGSLAAADLVVGFNVVRFDYEVLRGYGKFAAPKTLDMLVEVQKTLGHRLTLDSLAQATLGSTKTADGLEAIRWFKEGQLVKIAEYCCYDVKITRELFLHGREKKKLFYSSRDGDKRVVSVHW